MHGFLSSNYLALPLDHAQKLIETISMVISGIDTANFGMNLRQVLSLPIQVLTQDQGSDREQILKAIILMTSGTKSVDEVPPQQLQ